MKKLTMATIALVSFGLLATQVLAWGGGYCGSRVRDTGWYGTGRAERPVNTDAYRTFLNETTQIRQQLAAKKGEYRAVMRQADPDPQRASALSAEIASLHEQLRTEADKYGLDGAGAYGGPGSRYGYCSRGDVDPGNSYCGGWSRRGPGYRPW